jgi:hypothetical protein
MPQIDQPTKSAAIQVLIPELRIAARKLVHGSAMEIRKYDGGKCTKAADYALMK